jgi:hypothetical protein
VVDEKWDYSKLISTGRINEKSGSGALRKKENHKERLSGLIP